MMNKLATLFSVGFPGGYKTLVVFYISLIATAEVAADFSMLYFWVGLLTTFSGIPIASMMMAKESRFSAVQIALMLLLSSLLASLIVLGFLEVQLTVWQWLGLFIGVLTLSFYETFKIECINIGDHIGIASAGLVSTFLVFLALWLAKDSGVTLIGATFLVMALPMVVYTFSRKLVIWSSANNLGLAHGATFFQFCLSNAASTSVLMAVPIVMVAELGREEALLTAQIFTVSSLFMLLPRALSLLFIPKLRSGEASSKDVTRFFVILFVYAGVTGLLGLAVLYWLQTQYLLIFALLFIAMQLSQLSLPFVNVLMVGGKSKEIMISNWFAAGILAIALLPIYHFYSVGAERLTLVLYLFTGFQIIKVISTRYFANPHISQMGGVSL